MSPFTHLYTRNIYIIDKFCSKWDNSNWSKKSLFTFYKRLTLFPQQFKTVKNTSFALTNDGDNIIYSTYLRFYVQRMSFILSTISYYKKLIKSKQMKNLQNLYKISSVRKWQKWLIFVYKNYFTSSILKGNIAHMFQERCNIEKLLSLAPRNIIFVTFCPL